MRGLAVPAKLKIPLQLLLVVPFVVEIIAVVGLTGYLAYRNGQQAVYDLGSQLIEELSERVDERLNNYLEDPLLIVQINADATRIGQLSRENLPVIQNRFILQMQRLKTVQEVYLGTTDGEYLGIYRVDHETLKGAATPKLYQQLLTAPDNSLTPQSLKVRVNFDPRQRPWYKAALNADQLTWSPIYLFQGGQFGITAVQPFYNRNGKFEGVMAVDVVLTLLSDFLRQIKLTPSAQVFILERSGELVATSTGEVLFTVNSENNQMSRIRGIESQAFLTQATIQHLTQSLGSLSKIKRDQQLSFEVEGKRHFLSISPYSNDFGLDWLVVVVVPEADFMATINTNRRTTLILCLAALAIAILLGILITRWMSRAIRHLIRVSQYIASGTLDKRVQGSRVREINLLSQSFNQMAEQLKFAFEELEIRVQQRTSQLQDANQLLREEVWERKQSENKFSKAFHCNPNPSTITRMSDGHILEFNESALRFFGYQSSERVGHTTLELNIWADPKQQEEILEIVRQNGIIRSFECNFRTKSGEIRTGLYSAEVIELNGQTCILSIINDITDRKQAEVAIQERAALDYVISKISRKFIDQDVDTALHFALAEVGKITGSDRCYVIQSSTELQYFELTHEWCLDGIEPSVKPGHQFSSHNFNWSLKQLKNSDVLQMNLTDLPPEAIAEQDMMQRRKAKSMVAVALINSGTLVGSIGCDAVKAVKQWKTSELKLLRRVSEIIAISLERETAEQALKESQQKLAGILDNAEDAIISVDEDQKILLFNHGAEKIFGYSPSEVIGQPLNLLLPSNFQGIHNQYIQDFADAKCRSRRMAERSREVQGCRKNGALFPAEASISKLKVQESWIFTAILKDITLRKKAEIALEHAKDAAEAANQAKSEFLANMSHELRTPLNAILGFSQLMTRNQELTWEQRKNLDIINSSGEHLLGLINQILDLSKIEAGRISLDPISFDLYDLLNTLEKMFQLKASSQGLLLKFERDSTVPQYIKTDEGKLRQVLINLLGNAIKYTEQGGVTLTVTRETQDPPTLWFEISDTGSGISAEEIHSIFEAFVQTESGKNLQQGTGLGLPISRQFVRIMGGDITANSVVGEGTTFQFNIEVSLAKASDILPQTKPQKVIGIEPDQPTYRILVVDDKWENRQLLIELLKPVGFQVQEAENGQIAVEIWHRWKPDLIWMDIRMPVMDGYEATRQIRATPDGDTTVIIALTASAFEQDRGEVLAAGCHDFVGKPFLERIIFEKMAQYLGVRYLYQQKMQSFPTDEDLTPNIPNQTEQITPEHFKVMSPEWLTQMHQAALVGRDQHMLELIQDIPQDQEILSEVLQRLVENFEFDQIVELTQSQEA